MTLFIKTINIFKGSIRSIPSHIMHVNGQIRKNIYKMIAFNIVFPLKIKPLILIKPGEARDHSKSKN
jgi:hypothetical protein